MAFVMVKDDESLEHALRRFKKKVQNEGIMRDYKRSSFYMKPGEKKRLKEHRARKRIRRYLKRKQEREIW